MFGFVNADINALTKEDREIYRDYYCGLCEALGKKYGFFSRLTLNFDITFLIVFLTAYFNKEDSYYLKRCPIHPAKKHGVRQNEFTFYGAEMNILLTYYKLSDDWHDEKSQRAKLNMRFLEKHVKKIKSKYKSKAEKIENALKDIETAEKNGEHNPDIPASFFGIIMGEIFDFYSDGGELYDFGFNLGKVIYIMDACVDLKDDIKKCRYNPMVEISSADFQQILTVLLCDCTDIYDKMDIVKNKNIIDNVLFSGIWTRYRRNFS